jgi:diphosphomevalonate decarboxylase
MKKQIKALAHPSLALIKYWGKSDKGTNSPASGSIAVSLDEFTTTTSITHKDGLKDSKDSYKGDLIHFEISLNNETQNTDHFIPFFQSLEHEIKKHPDLYTELKKTPAQLSIKSTNNFPTAAGLASSSSGFAALAKACDGFFELELEDQSLSSLARIGSGSASRAIFGGITYYPQNALSAKQLHPKDYWPALRILIVEVSQAKKPISSRKAMELSRTSSPYYSAWVEDSEKLISKAQEAISEKNLTKLGETMRLSYLRMFSTMFSCDPPVIYWLPNSLALIHHCQVLRNEGIPVYETMDAGPQIKILCLDKNLDQIKQSIADQFPELILRSSTIGGKARIQ